MPPAPRTKAERHAETRAALLREAHADFAALGFADTATEAIVARAGVTRGALYYHFTDKAGLFEAVLEQVMADIDARIDRAAGPAGGAFAALRAGCLAYVDAALDPANRRIYLEDSVPVLGWDKRTALDLRHCGGSLLEGVEQTLAERPDPALAAGPVTALLSGALEAAAMHLAPHPDDAAARERMAAAIDTLLTRLFRRGP